MLLREVQAVCLALLPCCVLSATPLLQQCGKQSDDPETAGMLFQYRHNSSSVWFISDPKPKLAVLIVGLADRLVLAPKIPTVIQPSVAKGWDVDLYVSVVGKGNGSTAAWHPIDNNESAEIAEHLETEDAIKALASSGGWTVRLCELNTESLEVASSIPRNMPSRLQSYLPNVTEVGKNILRRFKAIELVMHHLQDMERAYGFSYDFVLVTKDDEHWLGSLNISTFFADSNHSRRVFTKECLQWWGVNDKTLLFGRQAAEAVLPRLYSDFWMDDPALNTVNTETFWAALFKIRGVESWPVEFHRLPTCDSIYLKREDGTPYLCQKQWYMCPGLPTGEGFEQPEFCPE